MSDQQDPSLADAMRSVRALGEDRHGVEPDGEERGAERVHPAGDGPGTAGNAVGDDDIEDDGHAVADDEVPGA